MAKEKSPVKHFFDQSFQGKEKQLRVHLQLSKSRLYLAYFHASSNTYVGIEEHHLGEHEHWNQAYEKIDPLFAALSKKYKAYSIALIDPNFSLIPTPLFSSENAVDYLQFDHKELNEELQLEQQEIESLNATVIFATPQKLFQLIKKHFTLFQLNHFITPLLEYCEINKADAKQQLLIHVQKDHFEVIYYKQKKLSFFNSFQYKKTEDFLYFFLYVLEQLYLNREELKVQVFGEIDKNDELYKMLYQYIAEVEFLSPPKELKFSTVLSTLAPQYYRNLFNQYLCE